MSDCTHTMAELSAMADHSARRPARPYAVSDPASVLITTPGMPAVTVAA